jgi:hypothetical protein
VARRFQLIGIIAAYAVNTTFTDINISGGVLSVNAASGDDIIYLGGIAGLMRESSVADCTVDIKIYASLGNTIPSCIGGVAGYLYENKTITNCFVLRDVEGSGGFDNGIGGLAGSSFGGGAIRNSLVSGNVKATMYGGSNAGGLVGHYGAGIIESCSVTGNVSSESTAASIERVSAGGLVGQLEGSDDGSTAAVIRRSYSTGTVSAGNLASASRPVRAGGIAGGISNSAEITDCYSTGDISADGGTAGSIEVCAGGIAGRPNPKVGNTTIARCYALGTISVAGSSSNKAAGGIAGNAYAESGGTGSITNCAALSGSGSITCEGSGTAKRIAGSTNFSLSYNIANSAMSGSSSDSGQDGADKTSSDLALQATYTTLGWDFSTVWKMSGDSPSRPILKWQP